MREGPEARCTLFGTLKRVLVNLLGTCRPRRLDQKFHNTQQKLRANLPSIKIEGNTADKGGCRPVILSPGIGTDIRYLGSPRGTNASDKFGDI